MDDAQIIESAPVGDPITAIFLPASEFLLPDPLTATNKVGVKIATCGFTIAYSPGTDPAPIIREKAQAIATAIEEKMLAAIKEPS